jgi:hypothetical protein
MKNKRLIIILITVGILLFVPLIVMQFTNEVNWNLLDFLVAGILLIGIGLIIELALRKILKMKYRILVLASILTLLILIWAELAVGIFGTPFGGH